MLHLNQEELLPAREFFAEFDLESLLPRLAGLLTIPSLQANSIRIETAVHLAVACCRGHRRIGRPGINHLLNAELGAISYREDPAEDVFVANVITPEGNRRILQGVWEANDYYAEVIIDVLLSQELPKECSRLLEPVLALLRISEKIAERLNLRRWQHEPCTPQGEIRIPPEAAIRRAASAVSFSDSQLLEMCVKPGLLAPFILGDSEKSRVLSQAIGNTLLERRPLVRNGKNLVCALPPSISIAIRRYVVGELLRTGRLDAFADALAEHQFQEVQLEVGREFKQFKPYKDTPRPKGKAPSLHSLVINYDIDKVLHVILIHERLELIEKHGFVGRSKYPRALAKNLSRYVRNVANWCRSQPGFREGTTLYVMGGLGGGSVLELRRPPSQWYSSHIGIPEFRMLASEHDRPLTRYLKFLKQWAWIENKGFRFYCLEHYTLYCHWCQTGYIPVPRELPLLAGSICPVLGGQARAVRAEVRLRADRHLLPNARGNYWPVRRLHSDSLFASQRQKTIYGSPYSVFAGFLSGAIVTGQGVSWLIASTRRDRSLMSLTYQIWEAFIDLFERLVAGLDRMRLNERRTVIEVRLDCSEVEPFDESSANEPPPMPLEPEVVINPAAGIATVRLPANFLHSFRQPENTGERLLLQSIAKGLLAIHGGGDARPETELLRSLVNGVFEDPGARVIHAFETTDPIDIIRHKKGARKAELLSQMDYRFLHVGLCDGLVSAEGASLLESKESCNALLHKIVDSLVDRLRGSLQVLDRTSVIRELLERQEAIIADRLHWNRTARAVVALHSQSGDGFSTSSEREAQRASTGLAIRSVIEMAICECPAVGGQQISSWEADELVATMLLAVNTGANSDAIHRKLAEPPIQVFANGDYEMDLSFLAQVMNPFLAAYNRSLTEVAAGNYEKLYRAEEPEGNEQISGIFPTDLVNAFQAEFGLSPEQAGRGIIELIDLAILREELVIETTVGQIKRQLITNCGYSQVECGHFLRSFGLFHRPRWDVPPAGCCITDIYPWRYGRKLSAIVRPLLVFGEHGDDKILYSVGMLRLGFAYLIDKIKDGHLSGEFFSSDQMKSYIGRVNDRLGRAFEKEVAAKFANGRWKVRERLRMSELGAPPELGDIDVLAWRRDGHVSLVECKRLQLARSVAEIAEICRRFRGEAQDELAKHLQRVQWVQENRAGLKQLLGFVPRVKRIHDIIVTSNQVPMVYLTSLPIPPHKIVPFPDLDL